MGLNVTSVEYKFTQPWPFPSQLMIACFCQTDGDTTDLDHDLNQLYHHLFDRNMRSLIEKEMAMVG